MRTRNSDGRNTTVNEKSNSFALFGDNVISRSDNNINLFSKNRYEGKENHRTEQTGSQNINEKSESFEFRSKENGCQTERKLRTFTNDKDYSDTENCTDYVKGQSGNETERNNRNAGNESRDSTTDDTGVIGKVKRRKRKIRESEGRTGICKDNDTNTETIDYSKCPVGEFDFTNKIKNFHIQYKPRIIDNFLSEIIIEGYRYTVSSTSIIGNQYVQGLDSNFLVKKYRNKR